MALPSSLQSYSDCLDFFEAVINDPKGGRIYVGDWSRAHHFRMRCNQARKLDREQSARIYPPEDIRHGTSAYDPLCFQIKVDTEGGYWVYATRMKLDPSQIELLSEVEDTVAIDGEAHEVYAIEDQSELD